MDQGLNFNVDYGLSPQILLYFILSLKRSLLKFEIKNPNYKSKYCRFFYNPFMKTLALILLTLLCLQQANSFLPCLQKIFAPKPAPKPQPPPPIFIQSNTFTLSLDWACRQGVRFDSCRGSVLWNGAVIYSIKPWDYNINSLSVHVNAKVGQNVLQLRGQGSSDCFGLTVDNVKLVRQGTCDNIVVNGNFEQPCTFGGWKYLDNIKGWAGHQIQIGAGKIYNCQWHSQVFELDSDRNTAISQYFNFDCQYNLVRNACY